MPPRTAVRETTAPLPQGSLAPVRVLLSRSISAYYDPIRQSHGHAATSRPGRLYPAPSPGGSAKATPETFPTFTAALSTRAIDPTPVGPLRPPVVCGEAIPGFLHLSKSRHPQRPSLPAILDGVVHFGAASFALCYDPRVCLALLTGYDGAQRHRLLRYIVTPASAPSVAGWRWGSG